MARRSTSTSQRSGTTLNRALPPSIVRDVHRRSADEWMRAVGERVGQREDEPGHRLDRVDAEGRCRAVRELAVRRRADPGAPALGEARAEARWARPRCTRRRAAARARAALRSRARRGTPRRRRDGSRGGRRGRGPSPADRARRRRARRRSGPSCRRSPVPTSMPSATTPSNGRMGPGHSDSPAGTTSRWPLNTRQRSPWPSDASTLGRPAVRPKGLGAPVQFFEHLGHDGGRPVLAAARDSRSGSGSVARASSTTSSASTAARHRAPPARCPGRPTMAQCTRATSAIGSVTAWIRDPMSCRPGGPARRGADPDDRCGTIPRSCSRNGPTSSASRRRDLLPGRDARPSGCDAGRDGPTGNRGGARDRGLRDRRAGSGRSRPHLRQQHPRRSVRRVAGDATSHATGPGGDRGGVGVPALGARRRRGDRWSGSAPMGTCIEGGRTSWTGGPSGVQRDRCSTPSSPGCANSRSVTPRGFARHPTAADPSERRHRCSSGSTSWHHSSNTIPERSSIPSVTMDGNWSA